MCVLFEMQRNGVQCELQLVIYEDRWMKGSRDGRGKGRLKGARLGGWPLGGRDEAEFQTDKRS